MQEYQSAMVLCAECVGRQAQGEGQQGEGEVQQGEGEVQQPDRRNLVACLVLGHATHTIQERHCRPRHRTRAGATYPHGNPIISSGIRSGTAERGSGTAERRSGPLNRETTDFARPFAGARWVDILPRAAARPELSAQVLLHAGPPFRGAPPVPVVNAAIQALLFEGLAADSAAARDLLLRGAVQLRPAQDHGIVTPLAQAVSRSMLLVAVEQQGQVYYAPIIEGPAPALRFGSAAPECLRKLREVSEWVNSVVAPLVRRKPIGIDELIRDAVAAGDECHARTAAANEAMVSRLDGLDTGSAAELRASPAFVLTILMAAAAVALRTHRSGIEALGGNGIDFGVRRRAGGGWRQVPAEPPRGLRFAGLDAAAALPAIGDSAVIDFCGLGGQALSAAPLLAAEWSRVLPADALTRRQVLIDPGTGIVDPARIAATGIAPLINLAILDGGGAAGLIGRGFYAPPASLFSG